MARARVAVLISGRGSNMRALVAAAAHPSYPADIVAVISNSQNAEGLAFAKSQGIATAAIDPRTLTPPKSFDEALTECLAQHRIDFIACAGFMRVLTPLVTGAWQGRIVNIHPSLLPLYKGLHTHERALANGDEWGGCTVHYVNDELDGGDIIAQTKLRILPGDTAETLAARVLVEEHKLYPPALAQAIEALKH